MRSWGLSLLLVACSANANEGWGDPAPQELVCNPLNVFGTYLIEFEQTSGNCPQQASGLVRLGESKLYGWARCTENALTRFSKNNCRQDSDLICTDGDAAFELVSVVTIHDLAASSASGIVTLTRESCIGTYNITYTRQ